MGVWPRENVLVTKHFPEGTGLVTILPICNAWPDREAMGPSSKNNASQLRAKMEDALIVKGRVS